jgi:hypothetical protein
MKSARKLFAILFLIVFALYAGNVYLDAGGSVFDAAAYAFPSGEGMQYYTNEAVFDVLPFRMDALEDHARLQKMLGKTESGGLDVVAANNGTYISGHAEAWSSYEAEQYAVRLYELKQNLKNAGSKAEVIYISAQPQVVNGYTQSLGHFPIEDQDAMMESLLYYLRAYGVDFLDTQFALAQTDLPVSGYIYKTDTIWTTQASFVAAQALAGKLNGQYGAGIGDGWRLFDTNNFEMTTYKNAFMGSMGMRAGESFTGREDFTTIVPKYETDFTYETVGWQNLSLNGSFDETLFNVEHLEPLDPYSYSAYATYMDGGADYRRVIVNHDQPDAPKALFIHDESALPFAPFMALGFGQTHMYWPA